MFNSFQVLLTILKSNTNKQEYNSKYSTCYKKTTKSKSIKIRTFCEKLKNNKIKTDDHIWAKYCSMNNSIRAKLSVV